MPQPDATLELDRAVEEAQAPADPPATSPAAPIGTAKPLGGGNGGPEPSEPRIHVPDYSEREDLLRRPFAPAAVKWRVLRGSQVIAYVDVRVVIERLNLIVPGLWSEETEPLPSGLLLCRLTVDGQTHEDVGEHTNKKGLYSDALKRVAVRFGVGVSVYAIPSRDMPLDSEFGRKRTVKDLNDEEVEVGPYVTRATKGTGMDLTTDGHRGLRWFYQRWLDQPETGGIARFGEPIDHGDVEDSAGEAVTPLEEEAVSDLPDVPAPLTDAEADDLRRDARNLYAGIVKLKGGRAKLPVARFNAELAQASLSHEDLRAYLERLRATEAELRS